MAGDGFVGDYPGQEFFHATNPNIKRAELAATAPTTMTTLQRIEKKLDALAEAKEDTIRFRKVLTEKLDEICARTGDTLAMINTIDFAVRKTLGEICDGVADLLALRLKPPRKKARRRK